MNPVRLLLLIGTLALENPGSALAASDHGDRELKNVIAEFQSSIVAKDKGRFQKLFYPGTVAWTAAYGDSSVQRGLAQHPERAKAYAGTPGAFMDMLAASKERFEETFSNVVIIADSDVASISFDYQFRKDGKATNHGKESWHLVRAADGWKITSVVYSVNLD